MAAVRPGEHVPQRDCVRPRVAAAQLLRVAALDAELERVELVLADVPALDLADEVRPAGRELVDAAGTVHDERACRLELDERVGERPRELRGVDAQHEGTRARRFVSGPSTLKTVRVASWRRTGAACRIAGW